MKTLELCFVGVCSLIVTACAMEEGIQDGTPEIAYGAHAITVVASSSPSKFVRVAAEERVPGRYIVVLEGAPPARLTADARAQVAATVDQLAAAHGATVEHRYEAALRGFSAEMTELAALALAQDPEVAFVQEDAAVHLDARIQTMPQNWGLDRIDQPALPLDQRYASIGEGDGVTVYIVDSGIRATHQVFAGRVLPGYDGVGDGRGTDDCNGHGTHVAGTVAGATVGIARGAKIVAIRVMDCAGTGNSSRIVAGIDHIAANHAPRSVANMSIGSNAPNEAIDAAVRNLVAAGVTVIASAGNDNRNACLQSPGREPAAITVAASTMTDARAGFSNFGPCVDIFAPGDGIFSAGITSDTIGTLKNGTSMAAPHVAGVAAAYLGANPGATPAQIRAAILGGGVTDRITDAQGSPNLLLSSLVIDQTPPELAIVSPQAGSVPGAFRVVGDATDPNLMRVDLEIDGAVAKSLTEGAIEFEVTGLAAGRHTIALVATDYSNHSVRRSIDVEVAGEGEPGDEEAPSGEVGGGCSAGGAATVGSAWLVALAALGARRRRQRR